MRCPFLLHGIFPTQGWKPVSLKSPALGGGSLLLVYLYSLLNCTFMICSSQYAQCQHSAWCIVDMQIIVADCWCHQPREATTNGMACQQQKGSRARPSTNSSGLTIHRVFSKCHCPPPPHPFSSFPLPHSLLISCLPAGKNENRAIQGRQLIRWSGRPAEAVS